MEERRKRKAKKREGDQIKFIDLRFERWQVVGLSEFVKEMVCWPIQSPNNGRKKKAKC